jgi:DNA invertase Pin-like site-specific DNA recombinase
MHAERVHPIVQKHGVAPKNTRLIAYLRPGQNKTICQQRAEITTFCDEHGYCVTAEFMDEHKPGPGLQEALQHLQNVDGIIASDLNRFVEHDSYRARDLRPLLHHFLSNRAKHLLVIEEGIDTSTAAGQLAVMESINQLKDADQDFHTNWFEVGYHP